MKTIITLLTLFAWQTAFSIDSTMVSHGLAGDCKSLTVEYKDINGFPSVAVTEDQTNPFYAEAAAGVNTDVKSCFVRMSFLVPANNKLGVYDSGPLHTYAGRFNGIQYLYDNDSLFAYRVGWDLQDAFAIPTQFSAYSHTGPLFANYFGSDLTAAMPTQWTVCKKAPQTVSLIVRIDLKTVSSKVNLAKLVFRNAHVRTATVPCKSISQLPDTVTATPLTPVTVRDPKVKPDPRTIYDDPKGKFTGAVKYLLAHVKKDNIRATYAELLETLAMIKSQLLDEMQNNPDLLNKSESLLHQLRIIEEFVTDKMGKHEKRQIKNSTRDMLEEALEVLAQDLAQNGPLSCQSSYAEAQREVLGKLGISLTEESLAAVPLMLATNQIVTNPKIVFAFLVKFLAPALAEQVVFHAATAPILGAASALMVAGFTVREIILVDKLVRIGKMKELVEGIQQHGATYDSFTDEVWNQPLRRVQKSHEYVMKKLGCEFDNGKKAFVNCDCFKVSASLPGIYGGEDINLCQQGGFKKYLNRLNSNKALCDGSLREDSKKISFLSKDDQLSFGKAHRRVVTLSQLMRACENHNSSRSHRP
ncbi:MAG: hypothetical protein HYV97_10065 [Bdellovibrio sp.]|nr:hypothetical protein [Bdellovibrio sp.]